MLVACKVTRSLETQEEGMMSAAASFPLVWNQGLIEPVGDQSHFWRLLVKECSAAQHQGFGANVEPAQHNQTTLPQLNSEVVNLTGLLKTKD